MKEFLKKNSIVSTVIITLLFGGLCLTSCGGGGPSSLSSSSESFVPAALTDALNGMQNGNYTYLLSNQEGETQYLFDVDKMKETSQDGEKIYYRTNSNYFLLTYDEAKDAWIKENIATINFNDYIYDDLIAAVWTSYDEDTGIVAGTMNGKEVNLKITNNSLTIEGDGFVKVVSDIQTTQFTFPSEDSIIEYGELPNDDIEALIDSLNNSNYTLEKRVDTNSTLYMIDENKWHIFDGIDDERGYYYLIEEENAYLLNFNAEDNLWHKTATEIKDETELIRTSLEQVVWMAYNKTTNEIEGTLNGENITMVLSSSIVEIKGDSFVYTIKDIGTTNVVLPSNENIYDETNPPILDEWLYEINPDGSYNFNIQGMIDILNEKNENDASWIDEYYRNLFIFRDRYIDSILFINSTKTSIDIGIDANQNGVKYFGSMTCKNDSWETFISDESNNKLSKFKEFLETTKKPFELEVYQIYYEYSTDTATEEQLSDFQAMTTNILNRLETVGIQPTSINNEGKDKIENYGSAEMLFGFKTAKPDRVQAGYDLGYTYNWDHYYVLSFDGQLEFVKMHVVAKQSGGAEANVINDSPKSWIITSITRENIDNGNMILFTSIVNGNV